MGTSRRDARRPNAAYGFEQPQFSLINYPERSFRVYACIGGICLYLFKPREGLRKECLVTHHEPRLRVTDEGRLVVLALTKRSFEDPSFPKPGSISLNSFSDDGMFYWSDDPDKAHEDLLARCLKDRATSARRIAKSLFVREEASGIRRIPGQDPTTKVDDPIAAAGRR